MTDKPTGYSGLKTKSPSYQRYPDKWIADTRRLSWAVKGIYQELLDVIWMQYQETCTIPDDDSLIAAEIGCTPEEWASARAEIMLKHRPLLTQKSGGLFSGGLWKEREKQCKFREKQRENGSKGGRPKGRKKTQGKAKKSPSSPSPSSLSSISFQKENTPPTPPEEITVGVGNDEQDDEQPKTDDLAPKPTPEEALIAKSPYGAFYVELRSVGVTFGRGFEDYAKLMHDFTAAAKVIQASRDKQAEIIALAANQVGGIQNAYAWLKAQLSRHSPRGEEKSRITSPLDT